MYGACTVLVRCFFMVSYGANRLLCIHYGREEEDIENVGSVCFSHKYRSRGGMDDGVAYFSDGVVAPTGNTGNSNSKNSVGLIPLPQYYWKDENILRYADP